MSTPIPSGLSAQLMTGEELTFGTGVTPDRGFEFRQESLEHQVQRIESSALRAGVRVQRSDRWAPGRQGVTGDITMELGTKGFGRWWKHALGGVATTQPDAVNSPTVYKHTFTPGNLPAGQTIQVGRPDNAGTVQPFTYRGCRIAQWTLENAVDQLVVMSMSILGRDCVTNVALAEVTYAAGNDVMSFIQGSLTVGGSALKIRNFTLQGVNALADERYNLGSALRDRPEEIGMRGISGNFETEFAGLTEYGRYVDGTEADVELLFQGDIIEDALRFQTKVSAHVRYDGGSPKVDGPQQLMQSLPWKVIDDGTLSIKVEYQTTDTTP